MQPVFKNKNDLNREELTLSQNLKLTFLVLFFRTKMESSLREFDPLNKLLKSIPNKIQKAFKSQSIEWTAIDVTEQYIAVGSNVGVVFLYNRSECNVQRLETKVSLCLMAPLLLLLK